MYKYMHDQSFSLQFADEGTIKQTSFFLTHTRRRVYNVHSLGKHHGLPE